MDASWAAALLYANLASHTILLAGALWCVAFPARRIYPMTSPDIWYYAMWALFGFVFLTNPLFVFTDWNSGLWTSPIRFWLAGPLIILGGGLVSWGMATLGSKRTSGLVDGLIAEGPYLLTRNPQYGGDLLLFMGVIVFSNSAVVAVTHLFTALVLLVGPIIEEPWLEEHYGDAYVGYRKNVSRYL